MFTLRNKRIFSIVMVGLLSLSVVACGNTNKVDSDNSRASTNKVEQNSSDSNVNQVFSDSNQVDNNSSEGKNVEFKTVNFGDTITTDFLEMTIEKASTSQELKPTDTSSVYSYMEDQDNETYFYITGNMKNVGGDSYSVEDMNIQMTFDDKYNYSGFIAADDGGYDFYGDYVKPFGSVKYYMYASIPDELISSYSTCKIRFAFHDNFKDDYKTDFSKYEYCYEINLTK